VNQTAKSKNGNIFAQVMYGTLGHGISPQNFQTDRNNFEQP